jgi:hypothetical protein
MRTRALLPTLVTGAVAAALLLLPVEPATAATPPAASITCDSATDTISTRLSGALAPNYSYQLKFEVYQGSYVTTAQAMGTIPAKGTSVTVPVTTGSDGLVSVAGYTRGWPAQSYLFYTETVRVHVLRASDGVQVESHDATCAYDLRTRLTVACDRQAHTVTATTDARSYPGGEHLVIAYRSVTTSQSTPDSLRFTSQVLGPADFYHTAQVPASGTWSDAGYTITFTTDPYYYERSTTIVVTDQSGLVVGSGAAGCVYADGTGA